MSTLSPRLFGDMSDWLEVDFPRPLPTIRVEERITDKAYVLHAATDEKGILAVTVPLTEPESVGRQITVTSR